MQTSAQSATADAGGGYALRVAVATDTGRILLNVPGDKAATRVKVEVNQETTVEPVAVVVEGAGTSQADSHPPWSYRPIRSTREPRRSRTNEDVRCALLGMQCNSR